MLNIFGELIKSGKFEKTFGDFKFEYFISEENEYKISIEVENLSASEKFLKNVKIGEIESSDLIFANNFESWGPCAYINPKKTFEFLKNTGLPANFTLSPVPHELKNGLISDYFMATDREFAGFLSSKITHPYFLWNDGKIDVKLYIGRIFNSHERMVLDPLWVKHTDGIEETLELYAQKVLSLNGTRRSKPLLGWASWYCYYLDINQKAFLEELSKAQENGIKYDVFQLDDGYEIDIGEWLETNDKFPDGLKFLSKKITEAGMIPGIWTAPFSVSESSKIFKEHIDWIVKDENGTPLVAYENWKKKIYALDLTTPEVLDWLEEVFSTLKNYGYEFFKIDFLFAGMIPGKRNLNFTPVEAYRMGMERISKVLGNAHILGCGAPLLPSIGFVNSMRIGPDTSSEWGEDMESWSGGAKHAIRNAFTRNFMNAWWVNDPDCAMARSTDTKLTWNEKLINVYLPALLNGQLIESDFLEKLSKEDIHFFLGAMNFRNGASNVRFVDKERFVVISKKTMNGDVISFVNLSNSLWNVTLSDYKKFLEPKEEEFFISYPSMKEEKEKVDVLPASISIILHRGRRILERDDEKEDDGRDIHYYWGDDR